MHACLIARPLATPAPSCPSVSHASRKVYDLTGPRSLSQVELVQAIGGALGRSLRVEELGPEPVFRQLGQFMNPDLAAALFGLMAATVGKPAQVTWAVEQITGHRARDFSAWAADHAADFS